MSELLFLLQNFKDRQLYIYSSSHNVLANKAAGVECCVMLLTMETATCFIRNSDRVLNSQ